MFVGASSDSRVTTREGAILVPYPQPMSDRGCERLRVDTGSVTVYFKPAEGLPAESRLVTDGPLIARDAARAAGDWKDVVRELRVVLAGSQRATTGSSRGAAEDEVFGSLPVGRLAEPVSDLVVILGAQADGRLAAFTLSVGGREVHRQAGAADRLVLPAAALRAGQTVRWTLRYGDQDKSGEVNVEPGTVLAALRARLDAESAGQADPLLRTLHTASGLVAAGFEWDARQLLARASRH